MLGPAASAGTLVDRGTSWGLWLQGPRFLELVSACWWTGLGLGCPGSAICPWWAEPGPEVSGCRSWGPGAGVSLLVQGPIPMAGCRAPGVPGLVLVHWWAGRVLGSLVGGAASWGGCGLRGFYVRWPADVWCCVPHRLAAWPEAFQYKC